MNWTRHFLVVLGGLAALVATTSAALAQDRTLAIDVVTVCDAQPAAPYAGLTYSANADPYIPATQTSTVGSHDQAVGFKVNPPDGLDQKYVIRRIDFFDHATGRRGELAQPRRSEATAFLDLNPIEAGADPRVTITVTVNVCGDQPETARVKVLTTASCYGVIGEREVVQGGVNVRIGAQSFTSNENGLIEADIPKGQHEVVGAWFDAPMSYVAQNGYQLPKGEMGIPTIRVDGEESLEVRIATCGPDGREIVRATVTTIAANGHVRVRRSKAVGRAFQGMKLRDGDTVTVTGDVVVTWADGHAITFTGSGQSTFTIGRGEDVPTAPRPQAQTSSFELLHGAASFLVPAGEPSKTDKFKAGTGTIALGVKGTAFVLTYDSRAELTTVTVTEGLVTVTPLNRQLQAFDLGPGQGAQISRSEVTPLAATPPPA